MGWHCFISRYNFAHVTVSNDKLSCFCDSSSLFSFSFYFGQGQSSGSRWKRLLCSSWDADRWKWSRWCMIPLISNCTFFWPPLFLWSTPVFLNCYNLVWGKLAQFNYPSSDHNWNVSLLIMLFSVYNKAVEK